MIIGLTGPLCAGIDTFAEILKKQYGFSWLAYSDILREELTKQRIEITRKNLQNLGDELRKTKGLEVLSILIAEKISQSPEKDYVIGKMRNPGEAHFMRKHFSKNFTLIMINASQQLRFERLANRRREKDPETFEEFKNVEGRDLGINQAEHGQQQAAVFPLADKIIENTTTIGELAKEAKALVEELKAKT